MPRSNTITRPLFWASIDAAWSSVPGSADARAAFQSTTRSVRKQAVKDLDGMFGQFYKKLIRDLAQYDSSQLSAWGEHWDTVFEECWNSGGDRDDEEYDEGGEVMYLCSFVVGIGRAAYDAFCDRSKKYLRYSPSAVYEHDMMNLVAEVKRVKAKQLSKASKRGKSSETSRKAKKAKTEAE